MSPILTILYICLTVTTTQNLGDPDLLSSYPPCAAQCQVEVISSVFNPCKTTSTNNLTCQCASANRAATAACEKVSCSPTEYDTTQTLAQEVCAPLYSNSSLDASSVSAAIASQTAAAVAAVSGKNVSNPNDYPPCAAACQVQNLPVTGCGSLANASCICNNGPLNVNNCIRNSCSLADRQTTEYLAYELCKSVGGLRNASDVANQTIATQTAGSVPMAPTGSEIPFTGEGGWRGVQAASWMLLSAAVVAMCMFV